MYNKNHSNTEKILILHHDEKGKCNIQRLFSDKKYNITLTFCKDEAAQKIKTYFFDLFLISCKVGENGLRLCRKIKKTSALKNLPIFFYSDTYSAEQKNAAYSAGGNDYLIKPFIRKEIEQKILQALLLRKVAQDNPRFLETGSLAAAEKSQNPDETEAINVALKNSVKHFRQLSEKTHIGICTTSIQGELLYTNTEIFKILDISPHTKNINWLNCEFYINNGLSAIYKEFLAQERLLIREHIIHGKGNRKIYISIIISPVFNVYNRFSGAEIMIIDITKQKKSEELIKLERDISFYLSKTGNRKLTLKFLLRYVYRVEEVGAIGLYSLKKTKEFSLEFEKSLFAFVQKKKERDFSREITKYLLLKKPTYISSSEFPKFLSDKVKAAFCEEVKSIVVLPVMWEGKFLLGMLLLIRNYSEVSEEFRHFLEALCVQIGESIVRIRTTEKLQKSEENYRTIVEGQNEIISRFFPDGTLTFVNKAYCSYFNAEYNDLVGRNWILKCSERTRKFVWNKLRELNPQNPTQHYDYKTFDSFGKQKWTQWTNKALFDENGNMIQIQSIGHDITCLKKTEEKLKSALKEKERLLSEVHHRVKNNMQMVSSMLKLQARTLNSENALESFHVSVNRIKSMAIIHEKLYESKNFGQIELKEYLADLCDGLINAYNNEKDINLRLNISPIMLEIDPAITLGLLLNELIMNALKYAFEGRDSGLLRISLYELYPKNYQLIVEDNGIGLPEDFEEKKKKSLGMKLIYGLANEMGGTIDIKSDKGTTFIVSFKKTRIETNI
ncbi:MAG: hypothetical protein CSB01_01640 [Bacteroidia bacterium]|nr:MAG: hypothetical protein CSB01_01640 [Bacteroidia bacterium]